MDERKRMTATERESLMRINLALSIVMNHRDKLARRTALVSRGSWYLGVARAMLEKYLDGCYRTIPAEQERILKRGMLEMTCHVGIRCSATMNAHIGRDYGVIVPMDVINTLFAACTDHCVTCMKTGEDQRRCELKKALDIVPNDAEDRPDGSCPYGSIL